MFREVIAIFALEAKLPCMKLNRIKMVFSGNSYIPDQIEKWIGNEC